jgi:hypothetical protein
MHESHQLYYNKLLTLLFIRKNTIVKYCDEIPESRNSEIGSEVDFLGNELLRQLHDNS